MNKDAIRITYIITVRGILMQNNIFKLTFVFFIVCCLFLVGCGDDNFQGDYATNISFQDGGEDSLLTFDMYRATPCDPADPDSDDEPFTDVLADIEITVTGDAPGLKLNGYTIEYIPELSEDGTHTLVMPPTLDNLYDMGSNNLYLPPNSTTTFTTTCFSIEQKEEYRLLISAFADLLFSRYTIRFIFYFTDDNGQSKEIEVRRTAYLGSYDRC